MASWHQILLKINLVNFYICIDDNRLHKCILFFQVHTCASQDYEMAYPCELNIPHGAVVFGRHGGSGTFSIPYAREAVQEVARKHKDWYFLFLNTNKFCDLPNVIFLPATADMAYKTKFINTCDAMIHARAEGETFGLACGEFSIKNKPVITCSNMGDRCHIEILDNKGLYYRSKSELLKILKSIGHNIDKVRSSEWDCYSKMYNPHVVMKKI